MRKLRDSCSSLDLIHIFGIFVFNLPKAAVRCLAKSVPVVVSPMAHLMPSQLAVKGLDFLIEGFAKAVNKSPSPQHPIRLRIVRQPWELPHSERTSSGAEWPRTTSLVTNVC